MVFALVRRRPVVAAGLALGTRYFIGDTFTQLVAEEKELADLDLRRLGCFVSFGCLMGAGPIYGYMGYVLPKLVQPRLSSHAAKCAAFAFMDIGLFMPLVYFPCFYTLREFIYHGGDDDEKGLAGLAGSGLAKMKTNFVDDMKSAAMILLPQDIFMQTLVPPHLRVPFISATGLIWVYVLSSKRGTEHEEEEAAEVRGGGS